MSDFESFICRPNPLEFEAVRFPNGGKTQFHVAQWVKQLGWKMPLWDGTVQQLDEPAEDGSMWRWSYALIHKPDDKFESQTVLFGDYIINLGNGELAVIRPWDFDYLYEQIEVTDHA